METIKINGTELKLTSGVGDYSAIRAYVAQLVTPEECKQRCFEAWQAATAPLASRKLDFLSWYTENFEAIKK